MTKNSKKFNARKRNDSIKNWGMELDRQLTEEGNNREVPNFFQHFQQSSKHKLKFQFYFIQMRMGKHRNTNVVQVLIW